MPMDIVIDTDVLVIGAGQAGLFAAIKAKEQGVTVTLVDKGYAGKAGQTQQICTMGIFDPAKHDLDAWVNAGRYTNEFIENREWVELTFKESLDRWNDMCSWGLKAYKYDTDGKVFISPAGDNDGEFIPGEKGLGGTGEGRAVTAVKFRFIPPRQQGDFMREQAKKIGVKIIDRLTITDLIKQDGAIVGAIGISADDETDSYIFQTKAVVLSTGNSGIKSVGIRTNTTTGDAQAMAYRVGCEITGKEWADFHPARADFPAWAWSSGLDRNLMVPKDKLAKFHGIAVYNAENERVDLMRKDENLRKRSTGPIFDGVAMAWEAHNGRAPIYFEVDKDPNTAPMNHSPKNMPRNQIDEVASKLGRVRMVMGRALGQSAHLSDGVWPNDTSCATAVPGLYAAGDCLGARPGYASAGFAAMFCSVTGTRAGTNAAEYAKTTPKVTIAKDEVARMKSTTWGPLNRIGGFTPKWAHEIILNTLAPYWVLLLKSGDRMQAALTQIEFLRDNIVPQLTAQDTHELRLAHEVRSMILHAEMKLKASMYRTESRWTHYREDYPMRDDPNWLAWVKIKDVGGVMTLSKEPIPEKNWPDLTLSYEERYPLSFPGEVKK